MDSHRTIVTVYTQAPGVHFCARVQVLQLRHRLRVRILAWVCLKKGCIDISTQRVPYSGTVSGHQVWRLPYFSVCNKGNRTRLPARRLIVPLMWNSALIKQNSFFFCRHKKLSCILYPFIYRHLQVYTNLSYHRCFLCSARRKEYTFVRTNCWNWNALECWQR